MAYNVLLLEPARAFFKEQAAEDRLAARELALVLLSLRQGAEPQGSRALEPILLEAAPGERVWERVDWIITYKVDPQAGTVTVGLIEKA